MADHLRWETGNKNGIKRRFPKFDLFAINDLSQRPGHVHGEANAVETGANAVVDEVSDLERFSAKIELVGLAPILPAPKFDSPEFGFLGEVDSVVCQRGGYGVQRRIMADIDELFAFGEGLLNRRDQSGDQFGRGLLIKQAHVTSLLQAKDLMFAVSKCGLHSYPIDSNRIWR